MKYEKGDEVHFGSFKVTVEEVDGGNNRYLVDVNKSDVNWKGWADEALLTKEKSKSDNYPWKD